MRSYCTCGSTRLIALCLRVLDRSLTRVTLAVFTMGFGQKRVPKGNTPRPFSAQKGCRLNPLTTWPTYCALVGQAVVLALLGRDWTRWSSWCPVCVALTLLLPPFNRVWTLFCPTTVVCLPLELAQIVPDLCVSVFGCCRGVQGFRCT